MSDEKQKWWDQFDPDKAPIETRPFRLHNKQWTSKSNSPVWWAWFVCVDGVTHSVGRFDDSDSAEVAGKNFLVTMRRGAEAYETKWGKAQALNRDFDQAPKDGTEFYAIVPLRWCARRETFSDREGDPWDDLFGIMAQGGGDHDMFLGWGKADD